MRARAALWLAALALALLAGCATPPRPPGLLGAVQGSGATQLDAQLAALAAPAPRGRLVFVGAALNGREDVFERDILDFDALLRARHGEGYRSVLLSNRRIEQGERALPLATIDHLDDVFDALAQQRRPDDRYVLLLSSHGGPGLLEVEQAALWKGSRYLTAAKLGVWASQLGDQPTWMLISACYSGSHLPKLDQPHLLVMTAAAANRTSFGCSNSEKNTWFVQELLAALQAAPQQPLQQVWQRTLAAIEARERAARLQPSQPQLKVGPAMKERFNASLEAF